MASSSVSFQLTTSSGREPLLSKSIRRVCFRGDERSPDEIFHGGFVGREFEYAMWDALHATNKQLKKEDLPKVKPVMSPVYGKPPEEWEKSNLHPFAPGTRASAIYENKFQTILGEQLPIFRDTTDKQSPISPMYDILPRSGVAVTYRPEIAPLFPVGRGKDFQQKIWVYAVWVVEAAETFMLQRQYRTDIAAAEEVVVQYVPFDHVLGAVECERNEVEPGKIAPILYKMGVELKWNPHVTRERYGAVYAAFQPLMGKNKTVMDSDLKWEAKPEAPSLPPMDLPPLPSTGDGNVPL